MQLAAREASVEKVWDLGIVEPTNSLTRYHAKFEQDADADCPEAYWQAQGNMTRTHSDMASPLPH